MYPDGTDLLSHFELGYLETILEGKYRPGHFQGVCQVVHRLLEIVQPLPFSLAGKITSNAW
jgi:pantoate--beta-alanine ligase